MTKKRLNTKLFDYLKKHSQQSEILSSQYYEDKSEKEKEEDTAFQEKLNQMIKKAHVMDYFNDPFYNFGSQSDNSSFTDIDAVFGHES